MLNTSQWDPLLASSGLHLNLCHQVLFKFSPWEVSPGSHVQDLHGLRVEPIHVVLLEDRLKLSLA